MPCVPKQSPVGKYWQHIYHIPHSINGILTCLRLFQHTELEHTPKKPLPTGFFRRDSFRSSGTGDWLGCAISGCVVTSLEPAVGWKFMQSSSHMRFFAATNSWGHPACSHRNWLVNRDTYIGLLYPYMGVSKNRGTRTQNGWFISWKTL